MVQYSPLDPQKSEIRLVTLLPGSSRDPIRCTLSTASLDSATEYTALSYVWGVPSKTIPITVDNEPFDATVNLEAGLRAIRKRWRPRALWIDAICINQKDIQEKNVQIPQMRRLYSTAPAVLVWLGTSIPSIEMFLSWIRAHAERRYDTALAYWLLLDARAALSESGKRGRDWGLVQALEGYYDFLALSHCGRVWTFQEYLLPRVEPWCLCGDTKPFKLSNVLGKNDIDTLKELALQAIHRLEVGYSNTNWEGLAMLAEVGDRMSTKAEFSVPRGIWNLPELRSFYEGRLAALLYYTANRQCFDEHDKIYALYGMVPTIQHVYPLDYAKPVPEVMLEAATYMLNFERGSSVLWYSFGLRDQRLSVASHSYPSWVPDFTQTALQLLFTSPLRSSNLHIMRGNVNVATPLKVSESENGPASVSVEHRTLRLRARCVGNCKVAVRFADTQSKILEQIKGLLEEHVLKNCTDQAIRKPESLVSRMARLCVAHSSTLSDISTKEILEDFYAVFNSRIGTHQDSSYEPNQSVVLNAVNALAGKDLLLTEDGCFGISTGGAKDGDIIVIPPEVQLPLVLTPESSTSVDGADYFRMVGTAIIDGVMEVGELFDEELVEDIAKRDVEEFLVH